jgi:hypothetical protein
MMPAFAVDAKAAIAARTIRITPVDPGSQSKKDCAAVATGVRSSWSALGSRTATMIMTPRT